MTIPDIIIAIDGYSSTGKSTLAKLISSEFSFLYLDSGAELLDQFAGDEEGLKEALEGPDAPDLRFEYGSDGSQTFIGTRNVEKEIRTMAVSSQVSPIATVPFVRAFVDRKLHEFGKKGRVVMDGRDIGTAVFPDAQLKIFVVARDEVRAQRRFDEMKAKGQEPVMEEVMKNLRERDYIDSHRETNPLRQAEDAFVLDNSDMNFHEEIVWTTGLLMGRFDIRS